LELDPETGAYLFDIASREETTPEALIKSLIHQRWGSLQSHQIIVERLGRHPEHLLEDAPPNLSERKYRKQAISDYLMKRHPRQLFSH
jgi:hypothetical protein